MQKEYIEKIIEAEQRSKSNTKRLDKLEVTTESIHELAISTKELASEVKAMREELNRMDKRVVAIEGKPQHKLDLLWGYVISAIVGGIIIFMLSKIGIK